LPAWVADHPGRRPSCWWACSAPRSPIGSYPGCWYDGKLVLPRERLGGIGTPKYEVLAFMPEFYLGVPCHWVEGEEVAYYNGLALDVNGKRIGTEYRPGHFKGVAIDPNDPPVYEAQATYLERYGLFLPGERRRLRKPDFEPESVAA
jgi:hypothetical protein